MKHRQQCCPHTGAALYPVPGTRNDWVCRASCWQSSSESSSMPVSPAMPRDWHPLCLPSQHQPAAPAPRAAGTVPQSRASFCSLKQHSFLFPGTETFATLTEFPFAIWYLSELEMQSRDEPWGPQESIPTTHLQLGAATRSSGDSPAGTEPRAVPAPAVGEPPGTGSPQRCACLARKDGVHTAASVRPDCSSTWYFHINSQGN